jgi:hypothetical protein
VKYDPSNRPEIVLGTRRAFVLKVLLWVVLVQALFITVWFVFILIKFRNNDSEGIVNFRTYIIGLALPAVVLLLITSGLAVRFSSRRNATFRMLATFTGGLLVMEAALVRGLPALGVSMTILGILLVGLAFWPDKAAKAENAANREPGKPAGPGAPAAGP